METRQQRLIRQALEHGSDEKRDKAAPEVSLRDQSLAHTADDYVPRTLTPHEWESYYAQHGVPKTHRQAKSPDTEPARRLGVLRRLLRR